MPEPDDRTETDQAEAEAKTETETTETDKAEAEVQVEIESRTGIRSQIGAINEMVMTTMAATKIVTVQINEPSVDVNDWLTQARLVVQTRST